MICMHCGACGGLVQVTEKQWRRDSFAVCPGCPDGGVDLVHARRHADEH